MTTAEWDADLARHGRVVFPADRRRIWRLVVGSGLAVALSPIAITQSPVPGALCLALFGTALALSSRALLVGAPLTVTTTALEVRHIWGRRRSFARTDVIDVGPGELRRDLLYVRLGDGTPRRPLPSLLDADRGELATWLVRWAAGGPA